MLYSRSSCSSSSGSSSRKCYLFRKKNLLRRKKGCARRLRPLLWPQACIFVKTETLAQVFSYEFCKISRNASLYRTPLVTASICLCFFVKHFSTPRNICSDRNCYFLLPRLICIPSTGPSLNYLKFTFNLYPVFDLLLFTFLAFLFV